MWKFVKLEKVRELLLWIFQTPTKKNFSNIHFFAKRAICEVLSCKICLAFWCVTITGRDFTRIVIMNFSNPLQFFFHILPFHQKSNVHSGKFALRFGMSPLQEVISLELSLWIFQTPCKKTFQIFHFFAKRTICVALYWEICLAFWCITIAGRNFTWISSPAKNIFNISLFHQKSNVRCIVLQNLPCILVYHHHRKEFYLDCHYECFQHLAIFFTFYCHLWTFFRSPITWDIRVLWVY